MYILTMPRLKESNSSSFSVVVLDTAAALNLTESPLAICGVKWKWPHFAFEAAT